jgi:8-oxo-dGTP pyrophosphatase MutT (NUDIX family)
MSAAAEPVARPAAPSGRASGILFISDQGRALLLRRGKGGDHPLRWGLPGGHLEEGETAETAARREVREETGYRFRGEMSLLADDGHFTTYIARGVKEFDVSLNDEHDGFVWCKPEEAPSELHPSLTDTFRIATATTELDVARLMVDGLLPSPQVFANMHLVALRVTGTGLAYRSSLGEHVWRDPSLYLNPEFLARCNGLTVIMDHPKGKVLTSEDFRNRAIGSIMLPYIKGEEVWGIARIYDDKAMKEILTSEVSTSPSVMFDDSAGNVTLKNEEGQPLLIEGRGFLLDHLAIVTEDFGSRGVWDKGGKPTGVDLSHNEVTTMTTATAKADDQGAPDKLDLILGKLDSISARVDAVEKNMPAPALKGASDRKDADGSGDGKMGKGGEIKPDADLGEEGKGGAEGKEKGVTKEGGKNKPGENEPAADAGKPFGEDGKDGKDGKGEKGEKADDDCMAAQADADAAAFADVQARADTIFAAFGKSASRPLVGETVQNYRKRLLRQLQPHSDSFKNVNLRSIADSALLDIAERTIFADAMKAAKAPVAHGDSLMEHREVDRAGRTISTFTGPMDAWLGAFKLPPMRAVQFHTANDRRH